MSKTGKTFFVTSFSKIQGRLNVRMSFAKAINSWTFTASKSFVPAKPAKALMLP